MADLVFGTKGQQEAFAAQTQLAKNSRALRDEFEAGAKATKTWDADIAKMQRTSEAALKSVQTEQEKIAAQIVSIQDAVKDGLYEGREQEAADAIERLQRKWVDVDAATVKAKEQAKLFEQQQQQLKSSAEAALGSVKTEYERIEEQLADLEQAAKDGLIPPEDAEAGLIKLKQRLADLETPINDAGDKFSALAQKINADFDPTNFKNIKSLAGLLGVPLGVGGAIALINRNLEDMEQRAAAAREFAVQEKSSEIDFARSGLQTGESQEALRKALAEALQIAAENAIPAEFVRGAIATGIGQGASPSEATDAARRLAPTYFDDPSKLAQAVANWLDPKKRPQWTPTRDELLYVTGGLDPVARQALIRQLREQRMRDQSKATAGGITSEEAEAINEIMFGDQRFSPLDDIDVGDDPREVAKRVRAIVRSRGGSFPGDRPRGGDGPPIVPSREQEEANRHRRRLIEIMESVDSKIDPLAGGIGN